MKINPELLNKVDQKNLIAMAKEIGIQSPNKVSKENLINAFLEAVESDPKRSPAVITTYNTIVKDLELDKDPDEENFNETEETKEESNQEEVTTPASKPAGRPAPPAKPTAGAKETKPKVEPKEKKSYNRFQAVGDALLSQKTGTIEELISLANEKYMAGGGKDNMKESKAITGMCVNVLTSLGTLTVDAGKYAYRA